jgi:hypothetical protein
VAAQDLSDAQRIAADEAIGRELLNIATFDR